MGAINPPYGTFATQANFAPYAFVKAGSNFTQTGQTFFDDVLYWGFNRTTGGVKIVDAAASIAWSLETDYWNSGVHALELNFDATGPNFTSATIGGTAASGGNLTLTATGNFAGSPHGVTVSASGGSTTTTLATALAAAIVADATFQTAGFTAYSSGAVVNLYATKAAVTAAVWSKTITGTATITLAAGTPWSTRPYGFGMDRDSGPDSPGYMNHTFRIGNGAGVGSFTIQSTEAAGNVHLLAVDGANPGYVTLGAASGTTSNLIMASTNTPTISCTNNTTLQVSLSGAVHFTMVNTDEFMLGSATDTRIARARAGTLRIASNGTGVQPHTSYFASTGVTPTLGTGAANFGTSPSMAAGSNDSCGKITVGTSPGSSGTMTFVMAWNTAPIVFAHNETTGNLIRCTATTSVATFTGTLTAGDVISYFAIGFGAG